MTQHQENNDQLAKWLSGELSLAEKQHLEEHEDLESLGVVMEDIGRWQLPPMDLDKGFNRLNSAKEAKVISIDRKRSSMHQLMKYAAAIVLLIGIFFVQDYFLASSEVLVSTKLGKTLEHEFPDGSTVHLDVLSSLTYDAEGWLEQRTMDLNGRALFQVKKGTEFKVQTKLGEISVLGTTFEVNARQEKFSVDCFKGSVQVSVGDRKKVLKKGEGVVLKNGQLIAAGVNVAQPDWVQGFLSYRNAHLEDVIQDLQRYYAVEISLPVKHIGDLYTGSYPTNDLESALKAIFLPMEIPYRFEDGRITFF